MPRQYFCPHCDETFGLGRSLQAHVNESHPLLAIGDDHSLPAEMAHFSAGAVEESEPYSRVPFTLRATGFYGDEEGS